MAKFSLIPFSKNQFPFELTSEVHSNQSSYFISYNLEGAINQIDFGTYSPDKKRKLKLWENTCFEFFLCHEDGHYLEFNFAPNFAWNAFTFKIIRGPLLELDIINNISMDILNSSEKFFLMATIDKSQLPEKFRDETKLKYGITTVLKLKNKDTEYWALTHQDQRPNFHMYESFIGKF